MLKSAIRRLVLSIAVVVGVVALISKPQTSAGGSWTGSGKNSTDRTTGDNAIRLGRLRIRIDVVAQLLAAGGLIFSAWQIGKATTQIELSQEQLNNSRYQDVYARQLDYEKIAIEQEKLAPYLFGGVSRNDVKLASESEEATLDAALLYALDFHAYIYEQISHTRPQLALRSSDLSKPAEMSDGDWEAMAHME